MPCQHMKSERALGRITIVSFALFCQQLYGESEPFTRAAGSREYRHHLFDIISIITLNIFGVEDVTHLGDMVVTGN